MEPDRAAVDASQRLPRGDALKAFLHSEAVGGLVLLVATAVALVWANSAAADSYTEFWHRTFTLGSGSWAVTEDYAHWVNDGLMAVFFFVVGLEIKRELVVGELRERRAAILPAAAALGGAVLPALLFVLLAPAGDARAGWGIPMATDIAFAVGVLAVLGATATAGAKLFLLSLAIVDDLIAIAVITLFYSHGVHLGWLAAAAALVALVVLMRRITWSPWAYVLPAFALWFAVLQSGVHATVAGVVLGLLTPATTGDRPPVIEPLEHVLHPVSTFVVVPLFALANAGIDLRGGALGRAFEQKLTWAVLLALVIGKLVGISGATVVTRRLRLGVLPSGMRPAENYPVAALGGIGFTVALFIADLAFEHDPRLVLQAKVGILAASLIAAVLGGLLLRLTRVRTAEKEARPGP